MLKVWALFIIDPSIAPISWQSFTKPMCSSLLTYSVSRPRTSDLRPLFTPHKLFGSGMAWLTDPLAVKDLADGQKNDLKVKPKRLMVHVPHIQFEFFFPCNGIPTVDLGPAGHSRLYLMTPCLFRGVKSTLKFSQRVEMLKMVWGSSTKFEATQKED